LNYLRVLDALMFALVGYFALNEYWSYHTTMNSQHEHLFEVATIGLVVYIMLRKSDVNTVTLGVTALVIFAIRKTLVISATQSSGAWVYVVYLLASLAAVYLIWFRPLIFASFGPWKGRKGFYVTRQDRYLWVVYVLNALFLLAVLVEHGLRRIDNTWYENARFLYNNYETIQFLFILAGIAVLYLMTFERSKEPHN